ncbi:MAG: dihydrolipoyl dehydrogenase family protein [Acidithiobacillales bacterium]
MPESFDLVAIGTGTAASAAAARCRASGWRVAVVDSRPFGGTCALRGCDPKKVLVGAADLLDWCRRMEGRGFRGEGARLEWRDLIRFKRTFTDPVPGMRAEAFERAGIVALSGRARFTGPGRIEVGGRTLEARHVLIATGSRPADLGIPGSEHLVTSDGFLELDALPRRLVFVGGGYISFEFAHIAARAGSHVTIVHRGPRPLAGFDPDLVGLLVKRSRSLGIDVQLDTRVIGIEREKDGLSVSAQGGRTSRADMVVHGAGRVPEIDDLGLDEAGVESGRRGVRVNEYLQSVSNPAVFAAGDAADTAGLPLTPVAGYEGRIAAENLLNGNRVSADYSGIPSVVFTIPPLARAGLSEEEARERRLAFRVNTMETSGWYSSRRVNAEGSGFKVLVEEPGGRILGAHLIGPQAEELINVFALAIRKELKASDLKEGLFAYPTHASDLPYMV